MHRKLISKVSSAETHQIDLESAAGIGTPKLTAAAENADEISVALGDFLPRIPVRFLKHAQHDETRAVRFKVSEISALIAAGKTKIPLARIAVGCPEIFRDTDETFQTTEIYFPWKKLAGMMDRISEKKSAPIAIENETADNFARPMASPVSGKIAAKNSLRLPSVSMPASQPAENLQRQRDLAIQQRDQTLARLKEVETRLQQQLAALTAERDFAIKEKADALAFILLRAQLGDGDHAAMDFSHSSR